MGNDKKKRKLPLALRIVIGVLIAIVALIIIAFVVLWIISPELFTFVITFVIPNLPKLLTGNNMKAAWIMFTSDNAAIVDQIDVNQQNKSETLGISPEVLAAIESGNYTEEEIGRILDTKGEALAEIDAEKLAATEKKEDNTENADGVDEIIAELSPEVIVAIESGKYTEEEIILIKETNGEAIADIDAQKAKDQEKKDQDSKAPEKIPEDTVVIPPEAEKKDEDEVNPPAAENVPKPDDDKATTQNPAVSETPSESEKPVPPTSEETTEQTPQAPAVNTGEIINKYVAKLYIVKNRFVSELGSMEKTIRKQYVSLPKEQQVPTSRKEIAKQYISFVSDLELECDSEVEAILSDLTAELKAVGGDLAIVDTIRAQYEEEKSLKKAYYLDVYMNGLPDKKPEEKTEEKADTKPAE